MAAQIDSTIRSLSSSYKPFNILLDLHLTTTNEYQGMDRFGRVKNLRWHLSTSPYPDSVRFNSTYDFDSNRTSAEDVVASNSKNYDEKYAYDGLARLG